MPTHTHFHTGIPCNPPVAGPSCTSPGTVISCDKGTGLLGPVWVCVHEVPAPAPAASPTPGGSSPKPTAPAPGPAPGPVAPPIASPKIKHTCETFDEGVQRGFVFAGVMNKKVGIAIQQANREATQRGKAAGEAASKLHECNAPCQKFDNVRIELWNPTIKKIGDDFTAIVVATWYLDILCAIVPSSEKGNQKGA
ncbi:MAG: hypothetical protein JWM04_598, partial [Verrucomicrobiales bacterium]|nr:hypothetical protein [Verrucomicrobiales bacterium]